MQTQMTTRRPYEKTHKLAVLKDKEQARLQLVVYTIVPLRQDDATAIVVFAS